MPRRSRGCQACRQRRIGCDGTLPSCRQCVITNRFCSGPVHHALIIDQTKAVTSRFKTNAVPATTKKGSAAMVRQPSAKDAACMAYVAEFMTFLTPATDGRGRPWLYELGEISPDARGPALDTSLEAAATVFCGISAGNPTVVMEACRLYGSALSRQYTAISQSGGVPTLATISTTVIFTLFETIWSAGTAAYAAHLLAARKMMSLAESELAQNELVQSLGAYIQCQTLFTMIIAPNAYLAALCTNESWDFMARCQNIGITNTSIRLFAELFRLAELFVKRNSSAGEIDVDPDEIDANIDAIWSEYHAEQSLNGQLIPVEPINATHYPDAFVAITVAYFAAARMLRYLLQPSTHQCRKRYVEDSGQIILNCSVFLTTQHLNCASLRMSFPLSLVSMHSTSLKQRGQAQRFLQGWLHITPFSGVCKLIDEQVRLGQPSGLAKQMPKGVVVMHT